MRPYHALVLLPIVILAGCGGAGTNDPSQLPIDPAFWDNLQCDSIHDLAFAITYYADNKSQGNDVLRIKDKTMASDVFLEQGLAAGQFACHPDKPGSVAAKSIMTSDAGASRRYVFTLKQGTIDGTVDFKDADGNAVTQTFAGHLTR